MSPKFFKYLKNDKTVLESKPLETVTQFKEIKAYRHEGFWQCMDHKLDKDLLDQMIKRKKLLGSNEKILVIGGTGFIGFHVIKGL